MQSSRNSQEPPENSSAAIENALRVYDVRNPVDGFGHAMIDSRLTWLRAGITCRNDTDEIPSTGFLQHQRTSAVTLKIKRLLRKRIGEEETGEEEQGNDSSFKQYAPTMTKVLT